jgi:hypothetical protein
MEQICQQLGLQYATEENEGRMFINLQGGPANMPPYPQPGGQGHHGGHQGGQQQHGGYQGGQPQQGGYHGGQQQQQGNDEIEQLVEKLLPKIIRKLEGCCVVM